MFQMTFNTVSAEVQVTATPSHWQDEETDKALVMFESGINGTCVLNKLKGKALLELTLDTPKLTLTLNGPLAAVPSERSNNFVKPFGMKGGKKLLTVSGVPALTALN